MKTFSHTHKGILLLSLSAAFFFILAPSALADLQCPAQGTPSNIEGCCYTGASAISTTGQEGCMINACPGNACPRQNIPIVTRTINTNPVNFTPGQAYFDIEKGIGLIEDLNQDSDVSINLVLSNNEKAAETGIGRFVDRLFLMMKNFYKNLFGGKNRIVSEDEKEPEDEGEVFLKEDYQNMLDGGDPDQARDSSYTYSHNCPPEIVLTLSHPLDNINWDYYCRKVKGENKGVEASLPTVEKDLYCEVDFNFSKEMQDSQIRECVADSDLSDKEKQAVLNSLN